MKTKLFLTALIATIIALPSGATKVLTPEHSTSEEYLRNYGHSDVMIEMIHKTKAKAKTTDDADIALAILIAQKQG